MIVAVSTTLRLLLLRQLMNDQSVVGPKTISAYVVPFANAHQGERVPDCEARLRFISGFTGSVGIAVITHTAALLWADGRYFIQAREEMDNNWTLMKDGLAETPTIEEYLAANLKAGDLIGIDPAVQSIAAWNAMQGKLKKAKQELVPVTKNLIDLVWEQDKESPRPACSDKPVIPVPMKYAGKSTKDKLADIQAIMKTRKISGVVLIQLDDIAWLLNLRGTDVPNGPLFLSFVIVKQDGFELFMSEKKLSKENMDAITQDGGKVYPYDQVTERLKALVDSTDGNILLDKLSCYNLVSLVPADRQIIEVSPAVIMKAIKNPVEIEAFKNTLVKDAAYLIRLYDWIEKSLAAGETLNEFLVVEKIVSLWKETDSYICPSYPTIIGADANGAQNHYTPSKESAKPVGPTTMLLIDAGANYVEGCTDTTRTFHYGEPTDFQREAYTRVLKGQIALVTTIFPMHTVGSRMDAFARKYLWDVGLNYKHRTGHGIGVFVHEGPSNIHMDFNLSPDDKGVAENMLFSNEPGYYEAGSFGVRLENIIQVVNSTVIGKDGNPFLTFEDITFVPYSRKLINKALLTEKEIEFINKYHQKCRDLVGNYVKTNYPGDSAYDWIIRETEPL